MKELRIIKAESGQRLDKYLGKLLPGAGMSFLFKMLRKKNILLNDKKATGKEILAEGDLVQVYFSDDTFATFSKGKMSSEKKPSHRREPAFYQVLDQNILYESDDLLMVNKPVGVLSQKATPT